MSNAVPHLVISGSQVSTHASHDEARAAAVEQAKRGVVVTVAQLVETIHLGAVLTDASGNTSVLPTTAA